MIDFIYSASLVVLGIVTLFTGIGLSVGCLNIGNHRLDANYIRSRLWMAIAMGLLLVCVYVHYHYQLRDFDNSVGTAFTLTFYYSVSRFFGLALITLCNPEYGTKLRFCTDILKSVVFAGVLGLTYYFSYSLLFHPMIMVAAFVFFADTMIMAFHFLRYYRSLRSNLSNYYSENYEAYINWMPMATFFAAIIGFSAPFLPFMSRIIIAGFNVVASLVFLYLFVCYERFMIFASFINRYAKRETVMSSISVPEAENKPEVCVTLPKSVLEQLGDWIDKKGYCRADINIQDLSVLIGTNRTYLSGYINSYYHQSFRTWIASLRIAEAKRLLASSDGSIADISRQLGFCNIAVFNRTFTSTVGQTPEEFRKHCCSN